MMRGSRDSRGEFSVERRWFPILTFLLLPLLLTFVLYRATLTQPYFWDDVPHFDFATTRTFLQIWTDVRGLSYYRPATFTLYKILFELLPVGATTIPHVFILLVHMANGWLVGNLARHLLQGSEKSDETSWFLGLATSDVARLLGALLFVSYPFAALPISHFAAVMHPLVTMFTVGATLSALLYANSHKRRWLVTAIVLALLAPFIHESGVMAGSVAAAVLLISDWSRAWKNWKLLIVLPCTSAVFLLAWLTVPKTPNTFEWIGWGGVLASTTFFAQGPTFPLQPLSRLVMDRLSQLDMGIPLTVVGMPWWDLVVIWAIALTALLIAGLLLWRARRLRILVISLVWAFFVALPSIVVLPFPYVSVSQRLLYAGGPPAALLWATVCVSLGARARHSWARHAIALGAAALIAAVPVAYIQREMALHELALWPLERLAAIGREHPRERHLAVNPVNWVNYKQPLYALGQEGVSVSAEYVDFDQLVRLNAGTTAEFFAVTFPPIKAELANHYHSTIGEKVPWSAADPATRTPEYDQLWLTAYNDESITVQHIGSVRPGPSIAPEEYLSSFDDKVYLVGATLEVQERTVIATLNWKYLEDLPGTTIFRHVTDCAGNLLGQGDGYSVGRMLPFEGLTAGTEVNDVRYIPLNASSGDGCYALSVGLYLPDGMRVMARDPHGQPLPDGAVRLTTTLTPSH
jgi:hypothetical protein